MQARRALDKIWSWLGEDRREVEILIVLLIFQLVILLLPQSPVQTNQTAAFTQWIAQLRPTLGSWLRPLRFLGLLNVRDAIIFRAALACLSVLVVVRVDMLRANWQEMQQLGRSAGLLFCIGGVLVITGWAIHLLWGWAIPEITVWPEMPIVVSERNLSLSPKPSRRLIWSEIYGVVLIRTGWSVGLEITAADEQGQPLVMLRSSKDEPQEKLKVILTGTPPEAFFLTPRTELVYRLHQVEDRYNAPVYAQVYRSASGKLLAEVLLDEHKPLMVETTHVTVQRLQLPSYRIIYNPGAPIEGVGLVLLMGSIILHAVRTNTAPDPSESLAPGASITT
ncbi:MAG: hypothetical protein P1S60_06765 [Anaerolineae bacterium]|nr:hypothetical protein [Anaerolineae bacterium]